MYLRHRKAASGWPHRRVVWCTAVSAIAANGTETEEIASRARREADHATGAGMREVAVCRRDHEFVVARFWRRAFSGELLAAFTFASSTFAWRGLRQTARICISSVLKKKGTRARIVPGPCRKQICFCSTALSAIPSSCASLPVVWHWQQLSVIGRNHLSVITWQ